MRLRRAAERDQRHGAIALALQLVLRGRGQAIELRDRAFVIGGGVELTDAVEAVLRERTRGRERQQRDQHRTENHGHFLKSTPRRVGAPTPTVTVSRRSPS